jgi:hypothetical protein
MAHATLTEAEGQQVRGDLVLAQAPQPTQGAAARTAAQHYFGTLALSLYARTHTTAVSYVVAIKAFRPRTIGL